MLEVEGGEHEWCMRILRHEAGHAIDNAYRAAPAPPPARAVRQPVGAVPRVLHAEAVQQELRAAPRLLVRAEPPGRGLRRDVRRLADARQQLGAALRRLAGAEEARVHGPADAVAGRARRPSSIAAEEVDPLSQPPPDAAPALPAEAAALRRGPPGLLRPRPAAPVLGRAGVRRQHHGGRSSSRASGGRSGGSSPSWTGIYQYTIDQVLEDIIERCRELKLRLAVPEDQARQEFTVLLTVQAMNYLHSGRHRLAL